MSERNKMIGIHVTEKEHELAKALAEASGEKLSVLFRNWLRKQARQQGVTLE